MPSAKKLIEYGLPLAAAVGGYALLRELHHDTRDSVMQAHLMNLRLQELEAQRNAGDHRALGGSTMPVLPLGVFSEEQAMGPLDPHAFDGVKMAAVRIARTAVLSAMKKEALLPFKATASVPGAVGRASGTVAKRKLKGAATQGALALGAGAALYGGHQAIQAGSRALEAPAKVKMQGYGIGLPRYVNQWGTPT